jgi:hypothetical protein
MLDAIVKHGFQLAHAAIDQELLAFTAQHYDKGIEPQYEVLMPFDSP